MTAAESRQNARVAPEMAGMRIDRALAELFPAWSRARLQQWLRDGQVTIDGIASRRGSERVTGGEEIALTVTLEPETAWDAEQIPLVVIDEDEALIVIDKPPGLVVHPGAGNRDGTLVNGLLHRYPELVNLPRAGIVHRLDKDTSGLLVVARTLAAHKSLVDQLQARTMGREYDAVVCGVMTAGGEVSEPVGRHPTQRTRMAVREGGKPALSRYRVVERFRAHTRIRVALESGRTHQIRVHMAHIRYPLVGDPVYGGRLRIPAGCSPALAEALHGFRRQALHAGRLRLLHPLDGEERSWNAPIPADMQALMTALHADAVS